MDSAALAEKLLNDLLKTTEGFQRLKKMHEELKSQTSGTNVYDSGLKQELERLQRENNQLHQQMINVKEESSNKVSQLSLQIKQLSGQICDQQLKESQLQEEVQTLRARSGANQSMGGQLTDSNQVF